MIERLFTVWANWANRSRISIMGLAYRSDGTRIGVQMINLSYSGCKLKTDQPMVIGEEVKLVIPRMQPINAEVRWTTG